MTSLPLNARALAAALCLGCVPACVHSKEQGADDTGATGSESAAEASDSSASPTESSATEPDDTQGSEVPAECIAPAPGVSAAFSIEGKWSDSEEIFRPCTVDAVELEPDTIVTALACDFEDGTGLGTIRVAAAAEGSPTWKAGDEVLLRTSMVSDFDADYEYWLIEMRRSSDDGLLLLALQGEVLQPEALAPLTMTAAFPCGPESKESFDIVPFQLDFELAGSSVGLLQGQRGALPLPESQAFAIDVEEANTNNCCHYIRWHKFLIRRVTTQ